MTVDDFVLPGWNDFSVAKTTDRLDTGLVGHSSRRKLAALDLAGQRDTYGRLGRC